MQKTQNQWVLTLDFPEVDEAPSPELTPLRSCSHVLPVC